MIREKMTRQHEKTKKEKRSKQTKYSVYQAGTT